MPEKISIWIVNLQERRLEAHRALIVDARQRFGFRFRDVTYYSQAEAATPLAVPASAAAVADLLP